MSLTVVEQMLTGAEQARVVRRAVHVIQRSASSVPTPLVLRVEDVGLLHFLSQKQQLLHAAIADTDVASHAALAPLAKLVEFVSFVVGGLIVEAEHVDEAVIGVRRDAALVGAEMRNCDIDMQEQQQHTGGNVAQAISQFYNTRLVVPCRSAAAPLAASAARSAAAGPYVSTLHALRARLKALKAQRAALTAVQRLLHGNGSEVGDTEAAAIASELDVLVVFRKALHRIRDVTYGVEQLDAVSSIVDFLAYLDAGLVGALDELQGSERGLRKLALMEGTSRQTERLAALDATNKRNSTAALRVNETLARDAARSMSVAEPHQTPPRADASSLLGISAVPQVRAAPTPAGGLHSALQRGPRPTSVFTPEVSRRDVGWVQHASPAATPVQQQQQQQQQAAAAPDHTQDMDAFMSQWCA
jgi:hypothetical protein